MTKSELKKLNTTIRELSYVSGLIMGMLHTEKNESIGDCLEAATSLLENIIENLINGIKEND